MARHALLGRPTRAAAVGALVLAGIGLTGPPAAAAGPSVAITAPAAGNVLDARDPVEVVAAVSGTTAAAGVQFFLDGTVLGVDLTAPYSVTWAAPTVGLHQFAARAADPRTGVAYSAPVWVAFAVLGPPRVVLDRTAIAVPEGGTASFGVRLSDRPSQPIVVLVRVTAGDPDLAVEPAGFGYLSFSAANWSVPQPVPVRAADDPDRTDGAATVTASRASTNSVFEVTLTATEVDDDR